MDAANADADALDDSPFNASRRKAGDVQPGTDLPMKRAAQALDEDHEGAARASAGSAASTAKRPSSDAGSAPEAPLVRVPGLDYGLLDNLLGYALRRAQNALYLDFHRATAKAQISPQRFAALVLVGRNPGMRQGVLAEAMGLHRSGALRLTDWLTDRGWVERRDDEADGRRWGLYLTAQGRRRLTTLEQQVQAHDQALIDALGDQAPALRAALETLAEIASGHCR